MKSDLKVNQIVEGIVSYLTEKKSLDLLPSVAKELLKHSWVRFDPNLAVVSSRNKLTDDQLTQIKKILSVKYNRKIRIKFVPDRSIIAGFKIKIAGEIIDGTINKKLIDLQKQILYD